MDMAQWADTIPYEILTGLSKRLPRTSWTANF
jgi:alanine racemase